MHESRKQNVLSVLTPIANDNAKKYLIVNANHQSKCVAFIFDNNNHYVAAASMWWLLKSITSTDAAIDSGRLYSSKQLLNCVIMPEMHFSCV